MEFDETQTETQTWQPKRGKGFKVIVWLLLIMNAIAAAAMLITTLM